MSESVTPTGGSVSYNFTDSTTTQLVNGSATTNLSFIGGSGAATVFGGTNSTLFGGTGGSSLLVAGTNATVMAGSGGNSSLVGGTGNSVMGEPASGANTFYVNPFATGSTTTTITLNDSANTVIGGAGAATVNAGSGANVFGFVSGHGGGSEVIYGFNAASTLAFGGYGAAPIASEGVVGGSDVIKLTDGTTITLEGIDHKVFNGIGS